MLVHGDSNEMGRLRSALTSKYADSEQPIAIHTPRNGETVLLHFRGEKTAKVIGKLAIQDPEEGMVVEGILASKDFNYQILDPFELQGFTELVPLPVVQKQRVVTSAPWTLVRYHLEQMYGEMVSKEPNFIVFNSVTLIPSNGYVDLRWDSSPSGDMIADSIVALILQADITPASVKGTYLII